MINKITLILGIVLVIGTIASALYSRWNTPNNLRGFYGGFYSMISIFGVIGGVGLIFLSRII